VEKQYVVNIINICLYSYLVIQNAKSTRHIILSSVAFLVEL
jgi:hypothetical protein